MVRRLPEFLLDDLLQIVDHVLHDQATFLDGTGAGRVQGARSGKQVVGGREAVIGGGALQVLLKEPVLFSNLIPSLHCLMSKRIKSDIDMPNFLASYSSFSASSGVTRNLIIFFCSFAISSTLVVKK